MAQDLWLRGSLRYCESMFRPLRKFWKLLQCSIVADELRVYFWGNRLVEGKDAPSLKIIKEERSLVIARDPHLCVNRPCGMSNHCDRFTLLSMEDAREIIRSISSSYAVTMLEDVRDCIESRVRASSSLQDLFRVQWKSRVDKKEGQCTLDPMAGCLGMPAIDVVAGCVPKARVPLVTVSIDIFRGTFLVQSRTTVDAIQLIACGEKSRLLRIVLSRAIRAKMLLKAEELRAALEHVVPTGSHFSLENDARGLIEEAVDSANTELVDLRTIIKNMKSIDVLVRLPYFASDPHGMMYTLSTSVSTEERSGDCIVQSFQLRIADTATLASRTIVIEATPAVAAKRQRLSEGTTGTSNSTDADIFGRIRVSAGSVIVMARAEALQHIFTRSFFVRNEVHMRAGYTVMTFDLKMFPKDVVRPVVAIRIFHDVEGHWDALAAPRNLDVPSIEDIFNKALHLDHLWTCAFSDSDVALMGTGEAYYRGCSFDTGAIDMLTIGTSKWLFARSSSFLSASPNSTLRQHFGGLTLVSSDVTPAVLTQSVVYGGLFPDANTTVTLRLTCTLGDRVCVDGNGNRGPKWALEMENCIFSADLYSRLKHLAAVNLLEQLDSLLQQILYPYVTVQHFRSVRGSDVLFLLVPDDPRRLSAVNKRKMMKINFFFHDRETIYTEANSEDDLRQGFVDPPAGFYQRLNLNDPNNIVQMSTFESMNPASFPGQRPRLTHKFCTRMFRHLLITFFGDEM